jgi:hypothetical protein
MYGANALLIITKHIKHVQWYYYPGGINFELVVKRCFTVYYLQARDEPETPGNVDLELSFGTDEENSGNELEVLIIYLFIKVFRQLSNNWIVD